MPRAGWVKPRDDQRLSDHVALGVLTRTFPPELVDAVVTHTGRRQQRSRLLPARLVACYVMAMTLFSSSGYEEVPAFNEEPYAHHWFEKRLGGRDPGTS